MDDDEVGGGAYYCAGRHLGGACIGPAIKRCGSCGAVRYCSLAHQKMHWLEHKEGCQRMAQQLKQAEVLEDFPFMFLKEVNLMFAKGNYFPCSYLEKLGVHGKGLWKRECECLHLKCETPAGQKEEGWRLQSSLCPCIDPSRPIVGKIKDWNQYYSWRQLPLHSPVALLLHHPLTLYHAINLVESRDPNLLASSKKYLSIHYLGPEREIDHIEVFAELLCLLPCVQITIDFVGPAVPSSKDREIVKLCSYPKCSNASCDCKLTSFTKENGEGNSNCYHRPLTMQLWKGFYHDIYDELAKKGKADLVLAPNAGIAAFSSWRPTIELLFQSNLPTIISDYCEEACILATRCIKIVHDCPLSYPVQINPFRQPFNFRSKLIDLPMYSNCFLFGIN